ncbi:MAG: hypothetical protein EKK46_11140 [Rhodocyclaceae bacterium]|nr:MAG: hypothetical protein EKK46_11140 [Rhodocyclaceae bacterium]
MSYSSSGGRRGGKQEIASAVSSHILPTSATMVGVCMTVLSIGRLSREGSLGLFIDKTLAFCSVLFLCGAVLSFASIRSRQGGRRYEEWAEECFLIGLVAATLSAVLIAFALG